MWHTGVKKNMLVIMVQQVTLTVTIADQLLGVIEYDTN